MTTARQPFPPARILWLKNVVRRDGTWAYCGDGVRPLHPEPREPGDEFFLHWPSRLRANANAPCRGDVIVLVQDGHVTHLVEVVDDAVSERQSQHIQPGTPDSEFKPQRRVRTLAVRGRGIAPTYADGLRFTPRVQGGACCRIEELKRFRDSEWPTKGGLAGLQAHLVATFTHAAGSVERG